MSATLAGYNVLSGFLRLPEEGNWTARLELDADECPTGPVSLVIDGETPDASSATFLGYASGDAWQGRADVTVWGGAGRLASVVLAPRSYVAAPTLPTVGRIIADVVSDAGELLFPGVAELLLRGVERWTRTRGTGEAALRAVCARADIAWRMLDSGLIWAGPRVYLPALPATEAALLVQRDDGAARVLHVAPDDASARPGTTVLGRSIREVVYLMSPDALRAELHYRRPDDP